MHLFLSIKATNITCKQNVLRTAWLWLNKSTSASTGLELLTGDVLEK